ncbi:unnamed protein product [Anisakis simplex]|uniref:ADP-ribosylglycohydrolase n=1 Tax=Anisakis simplex TaxID=6269 RepID=A0A0M3K2K7_ANISI|nr:unnamed protein product [Anisakis simplex]
MIGNSNGDMDEWMGGYANSLSYGCIASCIALKTLELKDEEKHSQLNGTTAWIEAKLLENMVGRKLKSWNK